MRFSPGNSGAFVHYECHHHHYHHHQHRCHMAQKLLAVERLVLDTADFALHLRIERECIFNRRIRSGSIKSIGRTGDMAELPFQLLQISRTTLKRPHGVVAAVAVVTCSWLAAGVWGLPARTRRPVGRVGRRRRL